MNTQSIKAIAIIIAGSLVAISIYFFSSGDKFVTSPSSVDTQPDNIVETLIANGLYPDSEEAEIAQKLYITGVDGSEILKTLYQRREVLAQITLSPSPTGEDLHPICSKPKRDVLTLALSEGANLNNLKEVAAIYDLICYGQTDIDTSDLQPQVNATNQFLESTSPVEQFQERMDKKCKEEIAQYNSCLIEYNAELAEWTACQFGNQTWGCSLSGVKPINTCGMSLSSICK